MTAGRVVLPLRNTSYDVGRTEDPRNFTHPSAEDLRAARDYVIERYGADAEYLRMLGLEGVS